MASNYSYSGTDFDSVFKTRGSYTATSNTNYSVAGQDLAQRYAPTASLGPGLRDTTTNRTSYQKVGIDLADIFRYINTPNSFLTGPSSVTSGSFNGERWTYSGTTDNSTLTGVIFQVVDHGSGIFSSVSTTTYTGSVVWADPFGSPSISNTPGTYTFYFQAMDANSLVGDRRMTVIVN